MSLVERDVYLRSLNSGYLPSVNPPLKGWDGWWMECRLPCRAGDWSPGGARSTRKGPSRPDGGSIPGAAHCPDDPPSSVLARVDPSRSRRRSTDTHLTSGAPFADTQYTIIACTPITYTGYAEIRETLGYRRNYVSKKYFRTGLRSRSRSRSESIVLEEVWVGVAKILPTATPKSESTLLLKGNISPSQNLFCNTIEMELM